MWRLLLAVLAPLVLLGGVELILRACGYGYPTAYFKPMTIQGEECLVGNDRFGWRFFPPSLARIPAPVVMKARKPAGTFRIFIFGESAAEGDPWPQFGAGRYLEVLLRERFPGAHFEIVNTAVTAINSHVIVPIARECAGYDGDLWIIYMGNNEMVGPFGAATAFGQRAPPLPLVRMGLALQRSRLGQLLMGFTRRLTAPAGTASSWQGLEMFLRNRIPPGDPRKQVVYENFRRNLEDILRAGSSAGARIILSTVAVNLKDCPPFASVTETNLPAPERAKLETCVSRASAAAARGAWPEAAQDFELAAELNPLSADWQFRLGECELRQTNSSAAREHFQAALDRDELIFRADSRINQMIRSAAREFAGRNVALCDAEGELAAGSPGNIPGRELFYEHVHLNFEGNYRLARAWAEHALTILPPEVLRGGAAGWASKETCERWLALTDWNRVSVIEEIIGRLRRPPFTGQFENDKRLAAFRSQVAELRRRMAATPAPEARKIYLDALERAPRDFNLHQNFAEFLDATGNAKEAADEETTLCSLIPHYYFPYYSLGTLLKQQGRLAEAREALLKAAALNPNQGLIHRELGLVLARQNHWAEAWQELERAQRLSPPDASVCLFSAEVLWNLERHSEAIANLRRALELNPDYWEAHYRLGEDLAVEGQVAEAAAEFQHVLRLQPDYVRAHANLAVALLKLNRPEEAAREFEETLRLDPKNQQAQEFMSQYGGGRARP